MGNKILTQYDVQKEPCYYSAELKWKLHSASFKERPEDKLTIFLFEKKVVDKYPKNTKENLLESLRKDATSLQRLRHPHILSVLEALVEERGTLAFATKPVVGTVAQLLENNRHELTPLEMKCGILDAVEGVQFLHQDAKTAHLGLSPNSIFIDPQGKWLLGGLGHSLSGVQWGQLIDSPFAFAGGEPGHLSSEPPPRYAAPEMCGMPAKCGLESDMFALGLITYELMSHERQPLLRTAPRAYTSSVLRQGAVPQELYPVLQRILSPNPSERPTVASFLSSEFFMDVNVRAIRFLEQLNEKDEVQRVTFLKGLPKLLQDQTSALCGQRVLRERVLPKLCSALLFTSLYGVVVPIIVAIIKREKVTDPVHFQARLWPSFKPLFTAKEIPIEVVTLFLRELDLLVGLAPSTDTQTVLLPFVLRCLELQEPVILNEVLEKVPYLHKRFEYRQVKDQILPRMLQLLLNSSVVKVKVQVLMGLSRIFEIFDNTTIVDVILTTFEKLTRTDRAPAVCMCLLGCYDGMSKHLGHKVTAERILPLVMPLLAEESLSCEQWETQLNIAKKLLQRVEAARRKEYDSKKEAQAEAGQALETEVVRPKASAPVKNEEPQTFESLLMGTPAPKPPAAPAAVPQPAPVAKQPPPPKPATTANKSSVDLLDSAAPAGSGGGGAFGGFDPFASTSTPVTGFGGFDPFAGSTPAPAPGGLAGLSMAPTPGGMPGVMPQLGGAAGGAAGFSAFPPAAPAMPGFGATPAAGANLMRNMSYDPFAEIDPDRGTPSAGAMPPAPGGMGMMPTASGGGMMPPPPGGYPQPGGGPNLTGLQGGSAFPPRGS